MWNYGKTQMGVSDSLQECSLAQDNIYMQCEWVHIAKETLTITFAGLAWLDIKQNS